ncbi:hypothetical protein WN943_006779 [Citrus x changshan-huyou]
MGGYFKPFHGDDKEGSQSSSKNEANCQIKRKPRQTMDLASLQRDQVDEASDEYQNQTTPNHSIKVFISLSLSSQFPFVFSCLCYGAYKVVENCAASHSLHNLKKVNANLSLL